MDTVDYKSLDIDLLHKKEAVIVSSECALKDIEPIKWEDAVVSGQEKVLLIADGSSGSSCIAK